MPTFCKASWPHLQKGKYGDGHVYYISTHFWYVVIPQPTYICMNKGSDNQIHGREEQGKQQDELETDHPFYSCYINAYKQKSINS